MIAVGGDSEEVGSLERAKLNGKSRSKAGGDATTTATARADVPGCRWIVNNITRAGGRFSLLQIRRRRLANGARRNARLKSADGRRYSRGFFFCRESPGAGGREK